MWDIFGAVLRLSLQPRPKSGSVSCTRSLLVGSHALALRASTPNGHLGHADKACWGVHLGAPPQRLLPRLFLLAVVFCNARENRPASFAIAARRFRKF